MGRKGETGREEVAQARTGGQARCKCVEIKGEIKSDIKSEVKSGIGGALGETKVVCFDTG